MASEFIGYDVLVTLRTPPNATVQGEVANVIGQRLLLRNVKLSWIGHALPTYSVDAPDIADLSLAPSTQPATEPVPATQETVNTTFAPPAPPAAQPFVDPAILSYSKPPLKPVGQSLEAGAPPPLQSTPVTRSGTQNPQLSQHPSRDQAAVLTEPFSNLELDVNKTALDNTPAAQPGTPGQPTLHYGPKANRRGGAPKAPKVVNEHDGAANTNPKTRGWRQTAFTEPSHPQLAEARNKQRRKKKGRANYAEDPNGWATEDATDIQEMGEFDFQSNLSKFDKRRVFEEIRNDDTTADEERLVSFNRRPKPGTNGGRNLHWTENVLDSLGESEEELTTDHVPSDAKLSSGTYSGRERKRSSMAPPSRKGSAILGQPLVPAQVNSLGRSQLSTSRTTSPRPNKTSVSASPISGPGVPGASLRLTTTNRSCPTVSPLQTLEVEQIAVAELGLTEDMLTENTGRGIAEAAVGLLASDAAAPTMLILTGNHRTGARAISAARHLRNRGHRVTVCMLGIEHENELLENCRKQLDVFKKIGGRVHRWEDLSARLSTSEFAPDLVVDALFGIHIAFEDLRTDDQATAFEMISWANRSNLEILSVDVPSGLSAISGEVTVVEGGRVCINAKSVVCLGAPKTGIVNALLSGEGLSWNLSVADIGIPQIVWRKYGSRRRHGIDFGNRWVVPLRYQPPPITHSEWASEDAFSASAGAGVSRAKRGGVDTSFKRLPFNFCSLSLQPFAHPVCTHEGTVFDLTNILPWIKKHGTNPVNGQPLKSADLIKLHLAKNEAGEYVDPVTYKVFTDNTHIVALRPSGNVFAWDTVERLNIKGKLWRDLVTDEEFTRKDIITLQDPQNIESRNLSSFNYIKEGESGLTDEQIREREDPANNVNANALGSSAKILKAREAVAKARSERAQRAGVAGAAAAASKDLAKTGGSGPAAALSQVKKSAAAAGKATPYNAARHTTGLAAASLTSTGMTPHTAADLALLSDEEYMLKRGRVKQKGYARISTTSGDINLELHTEYAPKAVWNFIKLAKKGYYRDVTFHRNIKGFMIQGGDPSGTGRGGESIWGKYFNDEFEGPLKHDSRGTLSMANKGKNTNSSQFFIAYRALPHLNHKHTIFGHVIDDPTPSSPTLNKLETHPTNSTTNRPTPDIRITDVTIFVDPFEEFLKQKQLEDAKARGHLTDPAEEEQNARREDDDRVTWTGKRVRGAGAGSTEEGSAGVGKYLKAALAERAGQAEDEIVEFVDDEPEPEPVRKKMRGGGGFGDFSSWD
ncbi:peptidyl-prolyl cis-trans isomerase [Aspergillus saccharolyticus JOP 1030-1]|uniref:Enhancer of mRNA-decapping protein 3 n=1 Tax=Aspergillus saccharolyticus JOP 1030-1 TaxID=1450539 RepID=A0A318Z8V5_9EURO|nr:peptidyl-prolyl cis-trans isomerase [Aspergillus saccharolyticus JOP 1030-1]PYH43781.1 peptidyl-prolyl cis-trans isomerase [Aspergillus saccharolyticus JOP 1030-1]